MAIKPRACVLMWIIMALPHAAAFALVATTARNNNNNRGTIHVSIAPFRGLVSTCSSAIGILSASAAQQQQEQDSELLEEPSTADYVIIQQKQSEALQLLQQAIAFDNNTTKSAANELLTRLNTLRQQDQDQTQSQLVESFLNHLLAMGPDNTQQPFWTRSKRLARFSKRARMASLRRTLDLTTPPPTSSPEQQEIQSQAQQQQQQQQQQQRRRALVSLLRSLSTLLEESSTSQKVPAIVQLELQARRATTETATAEWRRRLPPGLETPAYTVVDQLLASTTNMEIRKYEPYTVCAVSMTQPRPTNAVPTTDAKLQMPEQLNGASSFGALAGYLFGKNDQSKAMKMTTPVFTTTTTSTTTADDTDKGKQMEFVLPSEYWNTTTITTAPQPLATSGVVLQEKPADYRAVIMFGGYATPPQVELRTQQLQQALFKAKNWKVVPRATTTVAQYNDPFTVPWKRLNEVSIPVEPVL